MLSTKDDCYTSSAKYCACIEFRQDEHHRHGFQTGQLIDYTLEPNPNSLDAKDMPPQKLVVAFSTADVVILGWRLGILADKLRENDLATVQVLPRCYADHDRNKPFVASITITPIEKT